MTPTTRALLLCAGFLCALEGAALSPLGYCAGNQCVVLLQEPKDFPRAEKSCEDMSAKLFSIREEKPLALRSLLGGVRGSFWLARNSTGGASEGSAPGPQECNSVSVSSGGELTVLRKQCRDKLDGVLCRYTDVNPCGGLKASGGAQVRYITYWGFEVKDSGAFPQGTTAVVEKIGGKYPESKHVCTTGKWKQAPWQCEVLRGGCERECDRTRGTCTCPEGQTLHPNGVSCVKAGEACGQEGDANACKCRPGYELAPDGKECVDVNECKEEDKCTGEGEQCVNTPGGYECSCKDDFEMNNGVCVDSSICFKCEHDCVMRNGVFECRCREGYRVSAKDPTKCETHCTKKHCLAECDRNSETESKDMKQCRCPDGYISHLENDTNMCTDIDECENEKHCDHECVNLFGGFRCVCNDGYTLHNDHTCVPDEVEPTSSPPHPTPAFASPAAVPSYVKTGSLLGISVFVLLCAALLYCLARHTVKRCGKFNLSSFTSPDIDIFHLQQVTSETYKRLSFDKQFKNDVQRQ